MNNIQKRLFDLRDEGYKKFQASLVPTVDPSSIIGVRMPEIKKLAKELTEEEKREFLNAAPHEYYDENMLHGAILSLMKDFSEALAETDKFLIFIDNWAVCDTINPKAFAKNSELLLPHIRRWMGSIEPYSVRFGVGMLMRYYLDGKFRPQYLHEVAKIKSDEYCVKMMQAWFMATALAKQYEETLKIIENRELDPWVHNKTIQKARESFRVSSEHKNHLNALKI